MTQSCEIDLRHSPGAATWSDDGEVRKKSLDRTVPKARDNIAFGNPLLFLAVAMTSDAPVSPTPLSVTFARRTFLAASGAIVVAGLAPANASANGEDDRAIARSAPCTLNSEVLDGGGQITSVRIDASGAAGLDEGDIPLSACTVRAKV